MSIERIADVVAATGLALRGAFHPRPRDAVPDAAAAAPCQTLVLVGNAGPGMWARFAGSREHGDGKPDPLDRWSRRVVTALAGELGARALYPFGGPPWLPFQRWAVRAETLHQSPIGPMIHPRYGLWHAYRGALAFSERLDLEPAQATPSPCERCVDRPCLSACPVDAIATGAYDVPRCVAHVESAQGGDCSARGCAARRACPVGASFAYPAEQARFHISAFVRNHRRRAG